MKAFLLYFLLLLCIVLGPSVAHIYNERCIQCIEIDVHFHAVAFNNGSFYFNNDTQFAESLPPKVEASMEVLNNEFNETPFFFTLNNKQEPIAVVNRTTWTMNMCDNLTRERLNAWSFLGNFDTSINVYLGHQMRPNSAAVACATFPFYRTNAIMMNYEILPPEGNSLSLPHEVGHWLGLWHVYTPTFLASSSTDPCDAQNPGDFVDDTPLQLQFPHFNNFTNQTNWDSCPGQLGEDSFWNLMNRVCPRRECFQDRAFFTDGQVQRMYDTWLIVRDDFETCSSSQHLFTFSLIETSFFQQFIIFDSAGHEVFNFQTMWFNNGSFKANLCLSHEAAYTAVSYYAPASSSLDFEYSQDGEQVATSGDVVTAGTSTSTLVLPLDLEAESAMNFTDLYEPMKDADDCSSTEAELEVNVNGVMWVTLFDANSIGTTVTSNRTCIPKGRHYSLLVGLNSESAEEMIVKLNGLVIREVQGPFFYDIRSLPRIISTIITPDMLLEVLTVGPITVGPITAAPSDTLAQVTAPPTPESSSTGRSASSLDCYSMMFLLLRSTLAYLMDGH